MMFLSHNYKDKPIIEPIAESLAKVFGWKKVFYDSWSIQPGEGIIDCINKGLEESNLFFFFVSENSLKSNMVKLEWQNALYKATNGEIKFIPVRLDTSSIPSIFRQTFYIDFYSKGFAESLREMKCIVEGKTIYQSKYGESFENVKAIAVGNEKQFDVSIVAEFHMEPVTKYIVLFSNTLDEISVHLISDKINIGGYLDKITFNHGLVTNGYVFYVNRPISPDNPLVVKLIAKDSNIVNLLGVVKFASPHRFEAIDMFIQEN